MPDPIRSTVHAPPARETPSRTTIRVETGCLDGVPILPLMQILQHYGLELVNDGRDLLLRRQRGNQGC